MRFSFPKQVLVWLSPRKMSAQLNYTILGAAFASIILAEAIWLIPAIFTQEEKLLNQLADRARISVVAAIEESRFEDVALTQKTVRRLMAISQIKGGTIHDYQGNRIADFGEIPSLSWSAVSTDNQKRHLAPNRCCLDIFLSARDSGLRHHLILRLDSSQLGHQVWTHLSQIAGTVLIIALITCFGVVSQLYFWIVCPIIELKSTITDASQSLGTAKTLRWTRGDELGDLARGFDALMDNITNSFEETVQLSHQITQSTNLCIIHFGENKSLVEANPAALELFGEDSLSDLRRNTGSLFELNDPKGENEGKPLFDIIGTKSKIRPGIANSKLGPVSCLIATQALIDSKDVVKRYIITLIPTTALTYEINQLREMVTQGNEKIVEQKMQSSEMNLVIATNTSMMRTLKPEEPGLEPQIVSNCETIMARWTEEAKSFGVDLDLYIEAQLPSLIGDEATIQALFRQALLITYLRTMFAGPNISVKLEKDLTGAVNFVISDISVSRGRPYLPEGVSHLDYKDCLTALSSLIEKSGGKLIYNNDRPGAPNELSFWLPMVKDTIKTSEDGQTRQRKVEVGTANAA